MLEVRDIRKSFNGFAAVAGVSLGVPATASACPASRIEASSASASPRQSRLARDQKFGPWPRWASRAARTFSSTVSFGKILVRWNERPSPIPQILYGATPVTSRPLTNTLPTVGRK